MANEELNMNETNETVTNQDTPAETSEQISSGETNPQAEPAAEAAPVTEETAPAEPAKEEAPAESGNESPAETTPEVQNQEEKKAEPTAETTPAPKVNDMKEKENATFEQLKTIKENDESITVNVLSRIRGGLRVVYDDMQLFLPASHFSLKRNPTEDQMLNSVGTDIKVKIHELQEDEHGRKTVIVTRKNILENEFWDNISEGQQVEGIVSSIASFGVFVDLGGVEGLIHISRLSQVHVEDPKDIVKKGQNIKAVVVEANRETNRIALSHKEFEKSPWDDVPTEFPIDSVHKGIVRRLTDFGAYIELKPGVDGLLRTNEISWTKRLKSPSEVFKAGDEVDIKIIAINEDKKTITLSYKRTQPNPWDELKDKYPADKEMEAEVTQIVPQGAIVSVGEEVDGFMPRSKMKHILKGKKIPFQVGEKIQVTVVDIVPEEESLIFAPVVDEEMIQQAREENRRKPRQRSDRPMSSPKPSSSDTAFTLGDLLSDLDKDKLMNND